MAIVPSVIARRRLPPHEGLVHRTCQYFGPSLGVLFALFTKIAFEANCAGHKRLP